MFAAAHHPEHAPDRADLAALGRRSGSAPARALRRIGYLVTATLLAVACLACGEAERTWGSTESSDRSSASRTDRRGTPPPTPDYRELAAASGDPAAPTTEEQAAGSETDAPSPPREVTYPEAESLYHAGDYGRALRHFRVYAREHADNPWGHYMLGLSAWKAGELERAAGALEDALGRDPDHVKSLVNLSRVLLELGRPEEARTRIEKAVDLAPTSADALRVAGNVAHEVGETDAALRRYRQALAADAEDAWSANNLGLLLIRQGRYEEALGPLARAVELRPATGVFRNNLGVALERTGHLDLARRQYRKAADTGHPKADESLARLEGVEDRGGSGTVELEALSRRFAERVRGWTLEGLAARPLSPPSDTAESSSGPDTGTEGPDGGSGSPPAGGSPPADGTSDGPDESGGGEAPDSEGTRQRMPSR